MKELDELKEKCIQAMKDVDVFVDEHYDELCDEIREQWNIPKEVIAGWEIKIISNCGIICGCFRQSENDEWTRVIYNNGEWMNNNLIASNESVEYIRTDVFIDKACELLERMICEVTYEDLEGNSVQHYDKMEFIEDFKNYMKRE